MRKKNEGHISLDLNDKGLLGCGCSQLFNSGSSRHLYKKFFFFGACNLFLEFLFVARVLGHA